jgi:hypothetical protein
MNTNKYTMIAILAMAALALAMPLSGFAIKNLAFAQPSNNNCGNGSVVGACVATGDILSRNKVAAGVCAQVLATQGLCRITGTQ